MEKITKSISKILEVVLIVLMAVIVLDVSWQVITRFILKNPSSYTEELAGFLPIWIGLLGASYAFYTKSHLGIDIVVSKLEGMKRFTAEITVYTIVMLFALFVLIIGGWNLVNLTLTLNQISPAIGIPMGYVYLVLPLTGTLMFYFSIDAILNIIRNKENLIKNS